MVRYLALLSGILVFISSLHASGFRLTEQSLNGTALNSAYIAGAYGADSTYYNPANMGLGEYGDKHELEIDASIIYIPAFEFDAVSMDKGMNVTCDKVSGLLNGCDISANNGIQWGQHGGKNGAIVDGYAKKTLQPVPKIFYKTRTYEILGLKTNFGLNFTTPSGLSMDWGGEAGAFLDDVMIMMMEFNPVVSFKLSDQVAIGGGFRFLYSAGEFGNTLFVPIAFEQNQGMAGNDVHIQANGTTKVTQTSNAAANGYGYNLALTIRPFKSSDLLVAVTYRSNIALEMKGSLSATSYIDMGKMAQGTINMDADLTLGADLPPIVNIAIAKRFGKVLAEFVMETTYYGRARIFEFAYANQKFTQNIVGTDICVPILGCIGGNTADYVKPDEMLGAADYSAVAYGNGWKDATAYRLGLTYQHSPKLKIMGSFAYDKTPAPQGQFGIPDADAYAFGLGARYELWDGKADVGVAYSLALKDNRKSFLRSKDGLGQLQLLTFGAKYRF